MCDGLLFAMFFSYPKQLYLPYFCAEVDFPLLALLPNWDSFISMPALYDNIKDFICDLT